MIKNIKPSQVISQLLILQLQLLSLNKLIVLILLQPLNQTNTINISMTNNNKRMIIVIIMRATSGASSRSRITRQTHLRRSGRRIRRYRVRTHSSAIIHGNRLLLELQSRDATLKLANETEVHLGPVWRHVEELIGLEVGHSLWDHLELRDRCWFVVFELFD